MRSHFNWAAMILLAAGVLSGARSVHADELVYVYGPDCGACIKWQSEIGPIYDRTAEARLLPLRRITLTAWRAQRHPWAECETGPVHGTPTFIHMRDCREQDRVTGYSSDELFWLSLGRMSNRAESADGAAH